MLKLKTEAEMRQIRADSTKEASIEDYYIRQAGKYGCKQRKITPFYAPDGWPDRVCVWPDGKGTTDWAELKRPKGGRYSEGQLRVIADLRACGSHVATLHTREAVDAYFTNRSKELGVKIIKRGSRKGLHKLKQMQLAL